MRLAIALAACVMSGCAVSVNGLRNEAPSKSAEVAGDYRAIGDCIAEGMQSGPTGVLLNDLGDLAYEVINRQSAKRMTITGRMYNIPFIDVAVIHKGVGKTAIETRAGGMPSGRAGGLRMEQSAWVVIDRCSADSNSVRG